MSSRKLSEIVAIGSVSVGMTFVFRTVEILGSEYTAARKPPYEGEEVEIVGFRSRAVNNVVVRYGKGDVSVMPLVMAERALRLRERRTAADGNEQQ
jgi:hypothetical protein